MTSRPDRRRTKSTPAIKVEAQHRMLKHVEASIQGRIGSPSPEEMRRRIENGECPFCGGRYTNIAGHTNRAHGVDRHELKRMAGIPKTRSVCDPALSDRLADINRRAILENPSKKHKLRPKGLRRHFSDAGRESQRANAAIGREAYRRMMQGNDDVDGPQVQADAQVLEWFNSGISLKEIGRRIGKSERSVRRRLRNSGIAQDLRSTRSGRRACG